MFDLGMRAFRAGDYASAVVDLRSASEGLAASTDRAASYQMALVYLALAQFQGGYEDDARATILRLLEAERATPVFATLPLDTDARDFEALVAALVPEANLPRNPQLVVEEPLAALPPVRPVTPVTPDPVITEPSTTEPSTTEPSTTAPAIEAATEVRVEQIQAETDRRIAAIQADADRRIAEVQADADRRIAAAQAEADRRVAAAQTAANERIAAAEDQTRREADARVAELGRPAPRPAVTTPEVVTREETPEVFRPEVVTPEVVTRAPERAETPSPRTATLSGSEALTTLRQATDLATAGEHEAAQALYVRLANDRNVRREVLTEAAIGLYRINSFEESVAAFRRMDVFARGEEDLRYYFAVALYETGAYREAQKELYCALPFIEVTDEVARYRLKIEQSAAVSIVGNL
jgi:tetratricopeptide (TPR) repeat protein